MCFVYTIDSFEWIICFIVLYSSRGNSNRIHLESNHFGRESNSCYFVICYLMAQPLNTDESQSYFFVQLSTVRQCKNNRTMNKSSLFADVRAINRRKQKTPRIEFYVKKKFL